MAGSMEQLLVSWLLGCSLPINKKWLRRTYGEREREGWRGRERRGGGGGGGGGREEVCVQPRRWSHARGECPWLLCERVRGACKLRSFTGGREEREEKR